MKTFTMIEIAIEVALQLGDTDDSIPRAQSRWKLADIALDIINSGLIDANSEDIDEIIRGYLKNRGLI